MEETLGWGIRGKMWRVVKEMYSTVQSAVLVGEQTEWFDLSTMLPILFSHFINGLAREINEREGNRCRRKESAVLKLLMYADDIVLLAETCSMS